MGNKYVSPVSPVFHTIVTVSIVLQSTVRPRTSEYRLFNSHLDIHLMVVQDWSRTVFWIEDPDPYQLTNGEQKLAR